MRFENPANEYVESTNLSWLWAFLFPLLYFSAKGVWTHFVSYLLVAVVYYSFVFWWAILIGAAAVMKLRQEAGPELVLLSLVLVLLPSLAYSLFASQIMRTHYLRKGWKEIVRKRGGW